jgi:hypothetical protein
LGVLANLRVSTKVALVGAVAVGVGLLLSGLRVKQDLEVLQQVTERMALVDLEKVLPAVDALRARGFQLALDDFGTGVSSLYLLRRLPVDYVKVDRSFVRNLAVDVHDQAIIRSVVELCRGWGVSWWRRGWRRRRSWNGSAAWAWTTRRDTTSRGRGPWRKSWAGGEAAPQRALGAPRPRGGRRGLLSRPDYRPRVAMTRIPVRSAASRAEGCTTNPNRVPTGVPGS